MPGGDDHEPVTQAQDRSVQRAVFGAEDVDGMFGMYEVDQRLSVATKLDGHGYRAVVEGVERQVAVLQVDILVATHALLPRQAGPALANQLDPVAGEPDLPDAVARGGPDRRAHIVRVLGVDQHDRWGTPVPATHLPDLDTHPASVPITT